MMSPVTPSADPLPPRARVLVVDDEPLIRWSVSETLRHEGYTVVEAGDAKSALTAVNEGDSPFGVVVLDVRLPDSDGLSLLARLRSAMPGARIILMTAHGTPELADDALGLGAYCVISKPFGMAAIAEIVEQADDDRSA